MKYTKCHECWGLNGHHFSGCQSRGYSAVGPHPSAPIEEDDEPTQQLEMCCGGTCVRALCFIHATEPKAIAVDVGPSGDVWLPSECGQYLRRWLHGILVDEVPA